MILLISPSDPLFEDEALVRPSGTRHARTAVPRFSFASTRSLTLILLSNIGRILLKGDNISVLQAI